jgi:secreted trypsin-like serine protease
MMRSCLAFLFFALFLESSLVDGARTSGGTEWKIILGEITHKRAHLFFGQLIIEKSGDHYLCGSVQIASRFFLTAAHCVYDKNSGSGGYFLRTPHVSINSRNGVNTRALGIRMHPDYLGGDRCPRDNDIAVLYTAHDVPGPVAKLPPYRVIPQITFSFVTFFRAVCRF